VTDTGERCSKEVFWLHCGFSNSVSYCLSRCDNDRPIHQWRAPEETRVEGLPSPKPLTEKVDIYSLGNIFYRLMTGHDPWVEYRNKHKQIDDDSKRQIEKVKLKGIAPMLPDGAEQTKNVALIGIRNVMKKCFRANPEERPTAGEIVKELQDRVEYIEENWDIITGIKRTKIAPVGKT